MNPKLALILDGVGVAFQIIKSILILIILLAR